MVSTPLGMVTEVISVLPRKGKIGNGNNGVFQYHITANSKRNIFDLGKIVVIKYAVKNL